MAEDTKATKERVSKLTLRKRLNDKRKEPKAHSARFLALDEKVNSNEPLSLDQAIEKVKETATTKFDSSVELHLHLTAKKGKKGVDDELMRGMLQLPQGLGKKRNVVVLTEELIDQIAKTQVLDFDIALATPALMPKLGKVAKILGTKGKMPNPKAGTVTDKPEEVKAQIEAGRVEFRQDTGRNIHQMIGKASWENDKLIENAKAVLAAFPKNRISSLTITSTMGPAIKVTVVG
jgi:large subunit ribosomal protein L1